MIKYSIIVPVYNAHDYLKQCLDSLLMQSFTNFEIILVNDCSTDESLDICMKYKENYSNITVLNQENNKGVSAARNRGIKFAKGKYILFIDSDDFVSNNYFETLENLTNNKNDDFFSFGCFNYLVINENKTEIMQNEMNINVDSTATNAWNKFILNSFFLSPCNKIYKRDIILKHNINFDEKCVCYEDYLFNIEYSRFVHSFTCIDTPIYYYRIIENINHVTKRKWGKRFMISEKVAKATNRFITENSREPLNNLRRITYKAYLVELEASKIDFIEFNKDLNRLINDKYFLESLSSIEPKGIKIFLFLCLKRLKLNFICRFLVKKMI